MTYVRQWRATANGLEGLAALHNDGLLILDELSQMDPREAGEAAYLLANGQGKARASRLGMARAALQWDLLFLSAGEESLSALMARVDKTTSAGQEIRLADIEADAGAGMGAFEVLHGHESASALILREVEHVDRFRAGVFSGLKNNAWRAMNSYTHGGIQQAGRRNTGAYIEPDFPPESVIEVIKLAGSFALLAFQQIVLGANRMDLAEEALQRLGGTGRASHDREAGGEGGQ